MDVPIQRDSPSILFVSQRIRMSWSEEVLRPSQNGRQIFPWKISDSPWKTYVDGIPPDVLSE